ncbi:hypothetical protein HAX54_012342, partial [Datura stramonium]|nr:hypothetical protein [Datura stramonium]
FKESEDNVPFIYLLGEQPQAIGKCPCDGVGDEGKSHKKKDNKINQEKAELCDAMKQSRVEEEIQIKKMQT